MPVWNIASVADQPQLRLRRWCIYETDMKTRHFVGWNVTDGEGRASTAISTFDEKTRRGVTASGRVYQLEGPPGHDPDGEYVWHAWAIVNSVKSYRDVTGELGQKGRGPKATSNVPQKAAGIRLPHRGRNAKMDAPVKLTTTDDELARIAQERLIIG